MTINEFKEKDKELYTVMKICNTILTDEYGDFTASDKLNAVTLRNDIANERAKLYKEFVRTYSIN